jgi:hypothetical protein
MNYLYPIPGAQGNPNAFIADNTGQLGSVDQPLDGRTLVSIDYSQLTPGVTLTAFSFKVVPGGEPQLWIGKPALATAPAKALNFYISGGRSGAQYEVTIITTLGDTERRSDVLNVNMLGDNCGCHQFPMPQAFGDAVSGDGSIIVNESPRFFISGTPPVGAHVLDRWYFTTNGIVYDYISNGLTSGWVESGAGSGNQVKIIKMQPITPDGATSTFTLQAADGSTVNVAGSIDLFVSVDGVWQEGAAQYTAAGNQIMFAEAPTADSSIFIVWFVPVPGAR